MPMILIVDGRAADRQLVRDVLDRIGHAVIDAADAEQALTKARDAKPDLILSEILLPGMDGFEFCRRLQQDPDLRHVPFAFVTKYSGSKFKQLAREVGALRVLSKPVEPQELRPAVQELLSIGFVPDATQKLRRLDNDAFRKRHAKTVGSQLEEKVAELEQLARRYKLLSHTNQAIVRITDREQLFPAICRIAVEHGDLRFAAIVLMDQGPQRVRLLAQYGDGAGDHFIDFHAALSDSEAAGRSPIQAALASGKPVISNDFLDDATAAPWHDAARRAGIGASAVYPLRENGVIVGALELYASTSGFFTAAMVATLEEMVEDVAFALDNYARATAKMRAEKAAADAAEFNRLLIASSPVGIITYKAAGPAVSANEAVAEMIGGTREQLKAQNFRKIESWKKSGLLRLADQALAANRVVEHDVHLPSTTFGKEAWFTSRLVPFRYKSEQYLLALFSDITERIRGEQALRDKDQLLSETQRIAQVGGWQSDLLGGLTWCEEMYRIYGVSPATYNPTVESFLNMIHPEDRSAMQAWIAAELEGRNPDDLEFRVVRPDGSIRTINGRREPVYDSNKRLTGLRGTAQDVTERKEAERRIAYLNRVYAMLSGINSLIVHVSGRDELFREACRIAVEAGGFRMSLIGIVDRSTMEIVPVAWTGMDEDLLTAVKGFLSSKESASKTLMARAIREKKAVISNVVHGDPQILLSQRHAETGVRSLAVLPLIVADEAVGILALYAHEIEFFHDEELKLLTELVGDIAFGIDHIEQQERLHYLAYFDRLTGLANRRLFMDRVALHLRNAASGGHQLALFMIDLERFKNINDTLGWPAGDALLRQVAQWLTRNAGDASFVARVGADHFALVLPKVAPEGDLDLLLENTMAAFLNHTFQLNDVDYRIAAKVGVALFPDDGADADTLFKNAEAAVKKAKVGGDRYLFYAQRMTDTVAGSLGLENQLRQAVDKGEFVIHYQPKVHLVSGALTGAEALIRWNNPQTGLVQPGRFIRILEETGLIREVGRWVLRNALAEHLRWRSAGLPAVRVAVNVSALQLRSRGFIAEIEQIIAIAPDAAAGLELEITESLIMEDVKHSIATLQAIRAMGVRIAIDDFGTGFSSLSYLSKLPVDTLKIDRSFVVDMEKGEDGLTLVSVIINLAHALKLKVVAEGVETEEQLRQLRSLNCDEMQGYLYGKPVPGEIFERQYLSRSARG